MINKITTAVKLENGEVQNCTLKEKFNNENGQLIYRFHNEDSNQDYTLVKHGSEWASLSGSPVPDEIFKGLCDFIAQLDHEKL